MIKINITQKKPEKKYRVVDVAKALGISQNSIYGFFNNIDVSTKGGLSINQIVALAKYYANAKERKTNISWETVEEIRNILAEQYGIEILNVAD